MATEINNENTQEIEVEEKEEKEVVQENVTDKIEAPEPISLDPFDNTFIKFDKNVAYEPENTGGDNTQKNSYFDWNQDISMKDTYNSLFKDNEFSMINDDDEADDGGNFSFYKEVNFDPSEELTSLYLQAEGNNEKEKEQINSHISDGALEFIGYKEYILRSIKRPKDRIEAQRVFEENTGIKFWDFLNDNIPLNVVESENFQEGLNKVISYYDAKGIEWEIPNRNNLRPWVRQVQGLGLEIGGGLATDVATAPLLGMGPWGVTANVVINFGVGWELNIASQKARLGDKAKVGFGGQINYGEAFAAAVVQAIPFGSTAKGWKGIRQSGIFGGTLAGTELTIRTLIDEKRFPSVQEYLTAIGLGGSFGATFKGTMNQLEKYINKFADKSADEINKLITKNDKKKLDKIFSVLNKFKKAVDDNPTKKANVNGDDLEANKIKMVDGQVEPEVKNLDESIDNATKKKFNIGNISIGDFVLPKGYVKMSPRYGNVQLNFNSDIDKVAYILRGNRFFKKKPTESQIRTQERLTRLLEEQGISVSAVKKYGDKIHEKIKNLVKDQTGSFKATGEGTQGLKIDVPTDQAFVKANSKDLSSPELGDTNLNPTQTVLLKYVDEPNVTNFKNIVKALKSKGWTSLESESDQETLIKALGLFDPEQKDFSKKIIDISKTQLIESEAQKIENFHGITKTKEVNAALAITAVMSAENLNNANNAYLKALNSKNPEAIETAIVELSNKINDMKKWLTNYLVPASRAGQTLEKLNIEVKKDMGGKTAADYMADEGPQTKTLNEEKFANTINEVTFSADDLKKDLTRQLELSKQTGDYSELYRIGKMIQAAEGEPETLFGLTKVNAFRVKDDNPFNQSMRVVNEIGINGMLFRFGTNTANFISATLNTYYRQLKLFYGARNPEAFEAAMRHLVALHTNYHFMRTAYKKSMKLEDNFINIGNRKFENKFAIKSDGGGLGAGIINKSGQAIRFSGRNMTATDAMVQAPNLIADITYMAFLEAKRRSLQGDDINKFINKHKMAVLEWYAQNGNKKLDDLTKRFLIHAKKQAKFATFTQEIDTTGPFGGISKYADDKANQFPALRFMLSFTRTPTNLKEANYRMNPLFVPIVNPVNMQPINYPKSLPVIGGRNLNPLSEVFIPQLAKQLNSPDPKVRALAIGDINNAIAVVTAIGGFTVSANMLMSDPTYIPPLILTGGGPDFGKEEGKNMWINKYKNGWRPYSIGRLQYEENGEPKIGEDGKPVYRYDSYEGWLEPFAGTMKIIVDVTNSLGMFDGKPYDDLTTGLIASVVQNMYNDSWTSQFEEFINIFRDGSAPTDSSGDAVKNYRMKKVGDFVGRQFASRLPFSGLVSDLRRYPNDILRVMGFSHKEIKEIKGNLGPFRANQQRPDTKVRAGDVLTTGDPTDPNYEKSGNWSIINRAILNQFTAKYGIGADIPFDVEHITNEPIEYPNRIGGNVFGISVTSKSKNQPIWTALTQIGRRIQEPSEFITGDFNKEDFVPIRLNTNDYNALKIRINTVEVDVGYGEGTILESMNSYLKTDDYKSNRDIIEEEGLNSQAGQIAANAIFAELTYINKTYIGIVEQEYIDNNFSSNEQDRIMDYKSGIQIDYSDKYLRNLSN